MKETEAMANREKRTACGRGSRSHLLVSGQSHKLMHVWLGTIRESWKRERESEEKLVQWS